MHGAVRFQGTKRGVFGLMNWSPLPRPGETSAQSVEQIPITNVNGSLTRNILSQNVSSLNGNMNGQTYDRSCTDNVVDTRMKGDTSKKPPEAPSAGQRLIAKFGYIAKPDSPLGPGAEISLKTMDKMTMIGPHKHQDYWWLVRMDDGREGYVPANYVTLFEEKVTSLPWLASKVLDPLPQMSLKDQSSYKPYKSAYDNSGSGTQSGKPVSSWYCEVCQKNFNGPQPYNAHMTSRAHKDEVDVQNAYK